MITQAAAPPALRHGLVVEDLESSAEWLTHALRQAFPGMALSCAGTLAEARTQLRSTAPDIALIDLDLPDGSGTDLIGELSEQFPDGYSIVTTIFADDRHLFPALRAGAKGYLLKDQTLERVVAALQAMSAGEPPLSPTIANRLLRVFSAERATTSTGSLSARETEALVLISKGYKLAEVAAHMAVTRNTAAGYVKEIYRKLKISSRAEAALEAARMGLIRNQL